MPKQQMAFIQSPHIDNQGRQTSPSKEAVFAILKMSLQDHRRVIQPNE
jgi:hypothetical protein